MKIKVIERGETEFTASTEWTEPDIRAALASGDVDGNVREAILDTTDMERDTDTDEYVTVTEDDGTVLWSGWLTGDKDKPAPGDLGARLRAAEQVCVLFGWTGSSSDSDRDKALHELWHEWTDISGVSLSPKDHPELSDERIAELARRRDETRARTLAKIRAEDEAGVNS